MKKETKSERKAEAAKPLVAFETWFATKVQEGRLHRWQGSEIKKFFSSHSVSECEALDRFESCFRVFEGVK